MRVDHTSNKFRRVVKRLPWRDSDAEMKVPEECFFSDAGREYFRCAEADPECFGNDRSMLLVLFEHQDNSLRGLPVFRAIERVRFRPTALRDGDWYWENDGNIEVC